MRFIKRTAVFGLLFCLAFALCACGVKVSFDIGDATLVSGETVQVYQEDSPVVAPVVEKDGYVFDGWDGDFSAPEEDMTVRPTWKKVHMITFDTDGGTAVSNVALVQYVTDGDAATAPTVERTGYAFDGWDSDFSAPKADMTVKAKWKKIHTVIFDPNGGVPAEGATLVQNVVDGGSAIPPVVFKEKYNFVRWDAELSAVTGDMTVKAVWERKSFTSTEIYNLISPATVEIKTYRKNEVFFGMGSGFFIHEDGLLLTNYHVIADARMCRVFLSDNTVYEVTEVVGYDIEKDIAILRVDTEGEKVPYLEIGGDAPKVGDAVYAIGSSLGLTGTFSSGIVSHVNREIDGVRFIQTTTPISAGNSGGPLVNEKGYVIGINSASYTEGQNLNLAVEISQYLSVDRANITVEELFQREGTVEWYFGESAQLEDPTVSGNIGQVLKNGMTVFSTIENAYDVDYYMVESTGEVAVLLLMVKAPEAEKLQELGGLVFYGITANAQEGMLYPDSLIFSQLTDDGNGTQYLVVSVAIPEEYATQMKYIGVAFGANTRVDYALFMYLMTDLEDYM